MVFRTARNGHGIVARREQDGFAVGSIDLIVKKEIRGKAVCGIGVDPTSLVLDDEGGAGRCSVEILEFDTDFYGGLAVEEDSDFIAEADVLGSLADVEGEQGFAFADVAAVELNDAVFQSEPREFRIEWSTVEHLHVQPALSDVRHSDVHRGRLAAVTLAVLRSGVRADCLEEWGDTGLVVRFYEEGSPALLDEDFGGGAFFYFDSAFRVDVDSGDAVGVEDGLYFGDSLFVFGLGKQVLDSSFICGIQRGAGEAEGFDQTFGCGGEGLTFDLMDGQKLC